jgi:hypothetical protein
MNERIQELSEQAEKYADEWFRGEPTWSEAFESKFAELLIKETLQVAKVGIEFGPSMEEAVHTYFGISK